MPRTRTAKARVPKAAAKKKPGLYISDAMLGQSRIKQQKTEPFRPFDVAKPPPGVVPKGAGMAMDDAFADALGWATQATILGGYQDGTVFLGYPQLALLAQKPEYRRMSERIATEMTRKWGELQSSGDDDKTDKIKIIEAAMKRLNVRRAFREAAEQDLFFGRSHLYLDFGTTDDPDELKTPIGDGRDRTSRAKVARGSLRRITPVEARWCYPANYNSTNPLHPDFYKPSTWFVQGQEIHRSRFPTFVGRDVPDMLKPAYSFGGLSLSQMAQWYVEKWRQTADSVTDIVKAFSVFVLKGNFAEAMSANGSGDQFFRRADVFNNLRDNRGLLMIDKNTEDFANISTSLASLDVLQAQAQEHMAAVCGIPLVILTGISPTGLNASSEGEIRVFYDWIHAYQESLFSHHLKRVIDFIQLSELGEVDPEITFAFEPLWSLDAKEMAEKQKTEAETDAIRIESGVIDAQEARKRVADDPDLPYTSIDVEADINPPGPSELEQEQVVEKSTLAVK